MATRITDQHSWLPKPGDPNYQRTPRMRLLAHAPDLYLAVDERRMLLGDALAEFDRRQANR